MTIAPIKPPPTDQAGGVQTYPYGLLSRYSENELLQIESLKEKGAIRQRADTGFWVELVRTKLMLDHDDAAAGKRQFGGNGQQTAASRFTQAVCAGDLGDYVQEVLKMPTEEAQLSRWTPTNHRTFVNWLKRSKAAAELLDFGPQICGPKLLPAEAVVAAIDERDISKTTLDKFAVAPATVKELAQLTLQHQGQLRTDFIQYLEQLVVNYPELIEDVRKGIRIKTVKVPGDLRKMMEARKQALACEQAAVEARNEQAQKQFTAQVASVPAVEVQLVADQRAADEVQSMVRAGTPAYCEEDTTRPLTTYPVLECIDPNHRNPTYDHLRTDFERDTENFLSDMRKAYQLMRELRDIIKKWASYLQSEHTKSHQSQMLTWETWSVCWDRLGKFKKLGNVHHVTELMDRFTDILNQSKQAVTMVKHYAHFDTGKYRDFVVAETAADHWQPGRKQPVGRKDL